MKRNKTLKGLAKTTIVLTAFVTIGAIAPAIAFAEEKEAVKPEVEIVVTPVEDEVTTLPDVVAVPAPDEEMPVTVEILLNEDKPIVINEIPNYCF